MMCPLDDMTPFDPFLTGGKGEEVDVMLDIDNN